MIIAKFSTAWLNIHFGNSINNFSYLIYFFRSKFVLIFSLGKFISLDIPVSRYTDKLIFPVTLNAISTGSMCLFWDSWYVWHRIKLSQALVFKLSLRSLSSSKLLWSSCLCLPTLRLQTQSTWSGFSMGVEDMNSGPHVPGHLSVIFVCHTISRIEFIF